jgi:hypothetical protein
MHGERRNHWRMETQGLSFAQIYNDEFEIVGQLFDISQGGISVVYLPDIFDLLGLMRPYAPCRIDLLVSGRKAHISNLSGRIVYDRHLPNPSPFGIVTTKHCGLAFSDMSDKQRAEILRFMDRAFVSPENTKLQGIRRSL